MYVYVCMYVCMYIFSVFYFIVVLPISKFMLKKISKHT